MKTKDQMFSWLTQVCVNAYVGDMTPEQRASMCVGVALSWDHNLLCDLFGDSDQLYDECLAYYQERV